MKLKFQIALLIVALAAVLLGTSLLMRTNGPTNNTSTNTTIEETDPFFTDETVSDPLATDGPTTEEPATEAPETEVSVTTEPITEAPETECIHTYESQTNAATCTEDGTTVYTCSHCGDSYVETIPATGHSTETTTTEATCTEDGAKVTSCTVCGTVTKTETIPATGHSTETTTTDATCTEDGAKVTSCTVCGTVTKTETIPATGHSTETTTTAATCTEDGTKVTSCTVCGTVTKTETIPATGHNTKTTTTAATCTTDGKKVTSCTVCGTVTKTESIPATGHTTKTTTTAATCTTDGKKVTSCTVCGTVTKTETIPATGHSTKTTTTAATCTQSGKKVTTCTVCGAVTKTETLAAKGHNYVNGTCSRCGLSNIPTSYTRHTGTNKFTTSHNSHYANMNLSVAQNLPSGWGGTQYFLDGSTPYTWFITYSSAKWVNEIRLTDTGVVTSHTSDLAGIGVYYANSNTGWTKINVTVKRNGNDWVFVFSQAVEAKNFMLHMATPSNRIHCKWLEANFYGVYDPQGGANDAAYTYNGSSTPTGPKIKIYIDQGHNMAGNHNSGAQGNGLDEGRVVYNVGILLKNLLEADGRFEVMVSRPTASTVLGTNNSTSLSARYNAANSWGADYFVSLHCNAASADAHGIEVLTYTNNANNETYKFGNSILNALCSATGWRNRGMKQRTDLAVLMHTSMPAALVEMGFITNASEASVMANNPSLLANGIYRGILNYFGY